MPNIGNLEPSSLIAYAFGLILIYFVGRMFLMPLKWVFKLIYNGVIGGIMLFALNFVGAYFNFGVAINVVTALVVGFLGIPGLILLILLKVFFGINMNF